MRRWTRRSPSGGQSPRITRYRPGASRFSIVDPSGNTITFIRRDEPAEVEYGGSKELGGLARVLDNARILREFKSDDQAAFRALNSGLRRHGDEAPAVEQALALAALIELSTALGKSDLVPAWGDRLLVLSLTARDREQIRQSIATPDTLTPCPPPASHPTRLPPQPPSPPASPPPSPPR
ncbi:hypothetical protein [Micromonospora sp. DT229]|uniref:hypothetical protein n=1 Tax=Micromonospora sp. DT229 TaxID=3393430 RepID=UPI003CF62308